MLSNSRQPYITHKPEFMVIKPFFLLGSDWVYKYEKDIEFENSFNPILELQITDINTTFSILDNTGEEHFYDLNSRSKGVFIIRYHPVTTMVDFELLEFSSNDEMQKALDELYPEENDKWSRVAELLILDEKEYLEIYLGQNEYAYINANDHSECVDYIEGINKYTRIPDKYFIIKTDYKFLMSIYQG